MITDQAIIKSSGQYDKEVIQRLRLDNLGTVFTKTFEIHINCSTYSYMAELTSWLGIQRISNLDQCFTLMDLSLSHNEVQNNASVYADNADTIQLPWYLT